MTICSECGEPLQPLDVACNACGAPRPDEQAATQPANTGSASAGPTACDVGSSRLIGLNLGIIVFLFALINLLAYPLMEHAGRGRWIAIVWLGALFTQFALISVWWVFAPVSAMRRTVWGAVASCLWLALAIIGDSISVVGSYRTYGGTTINGPWQLHDLHYAIHATKKLTLSIPLMLLLVQLPLWILRIWFRWQIVYRSEVATVQHSEKLRIRDIMLITGVVAAALAVAKLGNVGSGQSDAHFFGLVFIYGAVFLGAATITIPPSLLAGMRRPREPKRIWRALIAQAVMVGGAGLGISFIEKYFPPAYVWGYYCAIGAIYFLAMITTFHFFARRGYRLLTKRDDPPAQPAGRLD